MLVEEDGDFNPFFPGLLQYDSSRSCKGRESCRKPSEMLLKYSSLLQLGEGSGLGQGKRSVSPPQKFLCLALLGNLNSVGGRGIVKRKGGRLVKAIVPAFPALLRGKGNI